MQDIGDVLGKLAGNIPGGLAGGAAASGSMALLDNCMKVSHYLRQGAHTGLSTDTVHGHDHCCKGGWAHRNNGASGYFQHCISEGHA